MWLLVLRVQQNVGNDGVPKDHAPGILQGQILHSDRRHDEETVQGKSLCCQRYLKAPTLKLWTSMLNWEPFLMSLLFHIQTWFILHKPLKKSNCLIYWHCGYCVTFSDLDPYWRPTSEGGEALEGILDQEKQHHHRQHVWLTAGNSQIFYWPYVAYPPFVLH